MITMIKELIEVDKNLEKVEIPTAKARGGAKIDITPEMWAFIKAALKFAKYFFIGKKKQKIVEIIEFIESFDTVRIINYLKYISWGQK